MLVMDTHPTASEIIDALGGTSAVAKMCDIKPPSVSEWRKAGIPRPWMKFLENKHRKVFKALRNGTLKEIS